MSIANLALPLFMLRFKFVDNVNTAFTTHYLVVGADLLYTRTHFHPSRISFKRMPCGSRLWRDTLLKFILLAVRYPTLREIVRRQFYRNAVSRHKTDVMFPHFAGDMGYDLVTVFELYTKLRPRQGLGYSPRQLDNFLIFGHKI